MCSRRCWLLDAARSTLADFESEAQRTGRRWALACAARCRGSARAAGDGRRDLRRGAPARRRTGLAVRARPDGDVLARAAATRWSPRRSPAATKAQLTASLQSPVAGFDPTKPLQRAAACRTLRAFSVVVQFVARPRKGPNGTPTRPFAPGKNSSAVSTLRRAGNLRNVRGAIRGRAKPEPLAAKRPREANVDYPDVRAGAAACCSCERQFSQRLVVKPDGGNRSGVRPQRFARTPDAAGGGGLRGRCLARTTQRCAWRASSHANRSPSLTRPRPAAHPKPRTLPGARS